MKIITGIVVAGLLTGCASAEQRMESKRDYRDAQVEAIKVQAEQQTARQTGEQLAEAAMWQSLAEAVKANPESASHFAIVMAVAASKSDAKGEQNTAMATIKTERDVTALDWAKVLTGPVLGTVTQVGIAALNTDLQKEISRNNTARDINDSDNDARLYGVIGEIVDNRDTGTSVTYTVSDNATVNTGTYTQDNDVSTVNEDNDISTTYTTTVNEDNDVTTTTTTTTSDDDIFVIGTTAEEADDLVDTAVTETSSFGVTDTTTDTTTETTTEVVDCSYMFSPQHPDCT